MDLPVERGQGGKGLQKMRKMIEPAFCDSDVLTFPMNLSERYSHLKHAGSMDPVDDSENLNPEDVHKSLRSTANAIQNYSFDSSSSPPQALFKNRDLTDAAPATLEEKM